MASFTPLERTLLRSLSTPTKIQDYLNALPFNYVPSNNTCLSPRGVMREERAQCVEGATFAAAALRTHGHRPLIVDLTAAKPDYDHVIAVFQQHGHWGAISKTNHAVLRYREPVYKTLRELVMSYFHEYFLDVNGKKTLRSYSAPINLSQFDRYHWETSEEPVWYIPERLLDVRHTPLLSTQQLRSLRAADAIEIAAGGIVEWPH